MPLLKKPHNRASDQSGEHQGSQDAQKKVTDVEFLLDFKCARRDDSVVHVDHHAGYQTDQEKSIGAYFH